MSLTNPEKVVTTEMLQEYHESILPYLGGMPAIVANKFDKGNLYSTDEKIVGQWIDGKPLYQKTLHYDYMPATYTVVVSGVDTLVNIFGKSVWVDNGRFDFMIPIYDDASHHCRFDRTSTGDVRVIQTGYTSSVTSDTYITVQYTKTTDSAISIGEDTDYSTEEKIIGTWIDGKPLYQKTVRFTTPPATTEYSTADAPFELPYSSIDVMVKIEGFTTRSDDWTVNLGSFDIGVPSQLNFGISFKSDFSKIYIAVGSLCKNCPSTVTFTYTKTTD